MRMEDMILRAVRTEDAEAIAALNESLGYPATVGTVRARLEALALGKDRTVLAAVSGSVVVGWIDAHLEQHLQSEPVITIGGLIVREDLRGHRIGQQLCCAVEAWAVQAGFGTVRVRSQQKRTGAHRFYVRNGYTQVKISAVFEKRVIPHD